MEEICIWVWHKYFITLYFHETQALVCLVILLLYNAVHVYIHTNAYNGTVSYKNALS